MVVFDGHVYSLKLLPSSVFVSFSLACATELPAGLILAIILDRWGRRFCGFITIGVTVILSSLQIVLTTGNCSGTGKTVTLTLAEQFRTINLDGFNCSAKVFSINNVAGH